MYDVFCAQRRVGSVHVTREGLYYKFYCTCALPNRDIHRLWVSDGENKWDLGICVPLGDRFTVTARLPVKQLRGEDWTFTLLPKNETAVPVAAGESFDHLAELENSRLCEIDGQPMIVIDPAPDPQDSDQTPESQNKSEWQ